MAIATLGAIPPKPTQPLSLRAVPYTAWGFFILILLAFFIGMSVARIISTLEPRTSTAEEPTQTLVQPRGPAKILVE